MNNEEKILSMLGNLMTAVDKLEQGQTKLEQGQNQTNERLDKLENKIDIIEVKVDRIEAQQKTDSSAIDLIVSHIYEIDTATDKTNTLTKKRLDAIELATKGNTYDIAELKKAQ